jgi:hypothetical protein
MSQCNRHTLDPSLFDLSTQPFSRDFLETSRSSEAPAACWETHKRYPSSASAHLSSFLSFSTLRIFFTGMENYHSLPILRSSAILCPFLVIKYAFTTSINNRKIQQKFTQSTSSPFSRQAFAKLEAYNKIVSAGHHFLFWRSWSTLLGYRSWSNLA